MNWLWATAWTFGNNQYYLKNNYNEETAGISYDAEGRQYESGIPLIGHETQHSPDFLKQGMYGFVGRYLFGHYTRGYWGDPLEDAARTTGRRVMGEIQSGRASVRAPGAGNKPM